MGSPSMKSRCCFGFVLTRDGKRKSPVWEHQWNSDNPLLDNVSRLRNKGGYYPQNNMISDCVTLFTLTRTFSWADSRAERKRVHLTCAFDYGHELKVSNFQHPTQYFNHPLFMSPIFTVENLTKRSAAGDFFVFWTI